jgi:hypothetical protein
LIEKYFQEEMDIIRAKPMWAKFDFHMRVALRYKARERAQRRATREMAQASQRGSGDG